MRDLISRPRWTVVAGVSVLFTAACLWLLLADDHAGYRFLRRLYQDKEFLKLTLREWGILAPVIFMAIQALPVVISPLPGPLPVAPLEPPDDAVAVVVER